MSRNASGTFTLAGTNPVVAGTVITADWANTLLADLALELTDSLSRSNKGAMLAPLKAYAGTFAAPGLTFDGDTDTGLYLGAANTVGLSVGGALSQTWSAAGCTMAQGLTITQSQANGVGLTVTGNGNGAGLVVTGGATAGGLTVTAGATSGFGINLGAGNTVNAPFHFTVGAQPSGPNFVGDLYMAAGGVLKICTVAGTPGTWVSVGTQV